jgi:hypothetical protein
VNTEEFDLLVASGKLRVELVADDAPKLRKVLAGRISLAVIDENVFHYYSERKVFNFPLPRPSPRGPAVGVAVLITGTRKTLTIFCSQ